MNDKVLFVYNAVPDDKRINCYSECITMNNVVQISHILSRKGYEIVHLNLRSPAQLQEFIYTKGPFLIAFCIAEGFLALPSTLYDGSGTPWVRQLLENISIPATHSSAAAMRICRNKDETYRVLAAAGIRIPVHSLIKPKMGFIEQQLSNIDRIMGYPLFVKPSGSGNSIGINDNSLVNSRVELKTQIDYILSQLDDSSILVENYLPGREYTIGIIGNKKKLVLPILGFPPHGGILTTQVKKSSSTKRQEQEVITSEDPRYWRLYKLAVDTFHAVGAQDILRIDVREDESGTPMVIDVNGTPSLSPSGSLPYMAAQTGISYDDLLAYILNTALERVYSKEVADVTG